MNKTLLERMLGQLGDRRPLRERMLAAKALLKPAAPLAGTMTWLDGSVIRVATLDPEPMLVAADVARALGIGLVGDLLRTLDEEMKGMDTIHTPGGPQRMATISRLGLYAVTFRSRKPRAKEFTNWALKQLDNILMNRPVEAPGGRVVQVPVTQVDQVKDFRRYFERLALNWSPPGYWTIFQELAPFVFRLINNGLPVDEHTMPDISVGKTWIKKWEQLDGDRVFGAREDMSHFYPAGFPQKKLVRAYLYPDAALPSFRAWFNGEYLHDKLPKYLKEKVGKKFITNVVMERLLAAVTPKALK